MSGKLAAGVNVLVENQAGQLIVLNGGTEVPSWASGQVGDHCMEQDVSQGKPTRKRDSGTSE